MTIQFCLVRRSSWRTMCLMNKIIQTISLFILVFLQVSDSSATDDWQRLAERYVDEMPALGPVGATGLGDHRFDNQLDDISPEARERSIAFYRGLRSEMDGIDRASLDRAQQVDYALLSHEVDYRLWTLETLQAWAWNPLVYTGLTGSAVYSLVARDFAPLPARLASAANRLEQFPRLLEQVRNTLEPERVPRVYAETAIKQNRGVLSILDNMVRPSLPELEEGLRRRLVAAMETAESAIEEHQKWLENTLLPSATADFRVGQKIFDAKLAFALHTPMSREQLGERSLTEFHRVRAEMYEIARGIYQEQYPMARLPDDPDSAYQQAIIRAGLEVAYQDLPGRDEIVATARSQIEQTLDFVREKDLVEVPDDPVEVIIMPEFARGVSIAYCDAPGPLDQGQKTFYAISPVPEDWSEEQVRSFLREYNVWSMQNLTIHEAVPGHWLQLAHSSRYPSTLRAVLGSGTFIEGWAVYAEQFMVDAGYNDDDPRPETDCTKMAAAWCDQRND